ncbi:MAG: helix-turn-helix domain-containing protein [Nocardioidaceae bacterium]|nr:helix-turn-helix domain-containing protein [Nocardioidaceae bacterium]
MTGDLTVRRLLEERQLRGARVLTGEEHLDRDVRWCHALADVLGDEDPDLTGVVVLADAARLDPQQWSDLLRSNCAAILVRSDTPVRPPAPPRGAEPPPVVQVAGSVHSRGLVELVATLSLAHQTHVLQYGQRVHSTLAQLLHRGAGLTSLCSRLARLSDCAVAVVGNDLHLLAFDPGPAALDPAAVTAALKSAEPCLSELSGHTPQSVAVLDLAVRDRSVTCLAGAIELVEQRDGWVVLIDDAEEVTDHDLAEHRVAVEQAVTIVGTELLRVRGLERAEERARGNFVHALLHARFTNHADLVARSSHYDFDTEARYAVIVAHSGGLIARGDSPAKLAEMARDAAKLAESPQRQTLTAVVGDAIAVVRQVSPSRRGQDDPATKELREYATALDRRLTERSQRDVLVAYGRPVEGAEAIVESYREARVALDLRQRLRVNDVCGFADLRVDSVLLELAQQQPGREFSTEMLDPLRAERDGRLVEVARAYVEAGGNINETARRLSVHRNTLLYKLDRITRLLQRNIREPDTQFAVWLAIRLTDLDETARRVNRDLASG